MRRGFAGDGVYGSDKVAGHGLHIERWNGQHQKQITFGNDKKRSRFPAGMTNKAEDKKEGRILRLYSASDTLTVSHSHVRLSESDVKTRRA